MHVDFADYHRIALLTGCETIDDVISWADAEIERRKAPEAELIAISLGKSRSIKEIAQLLAVLVVDLNDSAALAAVLARIAALVREGRFPIDEAISRIYNYAKSYNGDLHLAFMSLAEDLSCIRDGVFWTNDVTVLREPLLDTIGQFCNRSDDQMK